MELTVAQVANQGTRSERLVQQALRSGALVGHRRLGRMVSIDDLAATAWLRSLARGRQWSDNTREAALDLLSFGSTGRLAGSELSRLRGRLRLMTAEQVAHAAGGLGEWARYRGEASAEMQPVGPSTIDHRALGIVDGDTWMTFISTADLDEFELTTDVALDADGNLGVLERADTDDRVARVLLDTYLLGDDRLSRAAAAELETRAARV